MKIIISPAKKMINECNYIQDMTTPIFLDKTKQLLNHLQQLSYEDLKKLLACNDEIATLNYQRFQNMQLDANLNPALLSYDGIQYKYMAPDVFEDSYYPYINQHLRILSGFYGILKPLDGIVPYRLEMQAKLKTNFCKNLYDYWKEDIYKELTKDTKIILNLASDEYSKCISKYLTPDIQFINFTFAENVNGKLKEKGVYVKMARGEMVRYMAENQIENLEQIKQFNRLGFTYSSELSTNTHYVFIKGDN
ncbi:MAG: peroxide stress protein YaaA [Erysipelotrichaceae bacterium]|nr:peroxide stress protein YaaA [Erysipelotrichaceae bacterium]